MIKECEASKVDKGNITKELHNNLPNILILWIFWLFVWDNSCATSTSSFLELYCLHLHLVLSFIHSILSLVEHSNIFDPWDIEYHTELL